MVAATGSFTRIGTPAQGMTQLQLGIAERSAHQHVCMQQKPADCAIGKVQSRHTAEARC